MQTTRKILLILESTGAGVGRHVIDLATALDGTGCQVHLIYSGLRMEAGFRGELEKLERVRTCMINMRRAPHPGDILAAIKIRRYIARFGPFDVIHGHSSKGGALARLAAAGIPGSCIYTPHAFRTMDPLLHPAAHWLYKAIERGLCALTDAIIVVSEDEKRHATSLGLPVDKLHVVPNGIESGSLGPRDAARKKLSFDTNTVYIGFVGRLAPQKAPETLVEAFAGIAHRFENTCLVMLGDGPLRAMLHERAAQLGVSERIIWLQNMKGPAVMPAFDVFAMPSRYEGFPYVLLEAAAAELPIIATPVGGTSAVLKDEVNGFYIPVEQPARLEQALSRLMEDPALRRQMGQASGNIIRSFTIDTMLDRTLQVYASTGNVYRTQQQGA
jgi:glycosyltransferase involved in cell wall biosynthesis